MSNSGELSVTYLDDDATKWRVSGEREGVYYLVKQRGDGNCEIYLKASGKKLAHKTVAADHEAAMAWIENREQS